MIKKSDENQNETFDEKLMYFDVNRWENNMIRFYLKERKQNYLDQYK